MGGIYLLSCGKKILYWQAVLFAPPKSCICDLNLGNKNNPNLQKMKPPNQLSLKKAHWHARSNIGTL